MMRASVIATLLLVLSVAVWASAMCDHSFAGGDSFVLRAGRIMPVADDMPWEIDGGTIVVRQGKIVAIGADVDVPPDLPVVEFSSCTVIPGLVAAASDIGGDHDGEHSIAAGYLASDACDLYADHAVTLAAGVTTVHVSPGTHCLLSGQGAVVRLAGSPSARLLRENADLCVNLGPVVFNPPPKVTYPFPASADVPIVPPKWQRPASRMGQLLALREAIEQALGEKKPKNQPDNKADGDSDDEFNIHVGALAEAMRKKLPIRIHADQAADMLAGLKFIAENGQGGYLSGSPQAERIAPVIAKAGVPLVLRPEEQFRSPKNDIGTDPDAPEDRPVDYGKLSKVQLALAPPAGAPLADLRLAAVRAATFGLGQKRALKAITRTPAEILGIGDKVGSLEVGKQADLLILSGGPLEVASHVQRVYVAGRCEFKPREQSSLVIKAGTVWTGPGKEIENGQVLVEDGKIVAVGRSVPHPPVARVIDTRPDGFLCPGMIDSHGHLGLEGDRGEIDGKVRLSKLLGVTDVTHQRVAAAGITTVMMSPYSAAGSGSPLAAVKTAGPRRAERIVRDPAGLLFDFSRVDHMKIKQTLKSSLEPGKKYLETWTKYEKELKEFLEKQSAKEDKESEKKEDKPQGDKDKPAKESAEDKDKPEEKPDKDESDKKDDAKKQGEAKRPEPPKINESLEPMRRLLEKKLPAVVKVSTAVQIREVLAVLVDEYDLPVILLGAEDSYLHAKQMAEKDVAVIVPTVVLRRRDRRDYHQADDLSRRGVPVLFQSDAEDGARSLPAVVLHAVERGLDAEQALESMTSGAAEAYKIDDRVGRIAPGLDADLVIFNGHPFREAGRVLRVIVGGKEVRK